MSFTPQCYKIDEVAAELHNSQHRKRDNTPLLILLYQLAAEVANRIYIVTRLTALDYAQPIRCIKAPTASSSNYDLAY
jgi:hypothetical protein